MATVDLPAFKRPPKTRSAGTVLLAFAACVFIMFAVFALVGGYLYKQDETSCKYTCAKEGRVWAEQILLDPPNRTVCVCWDVPAHLVRAEETP